MPIIKHRHIKKAQKWYMCADCERTITIGMSYHYFFGMAHTGEKPYSLRICEPCNERFNEVRKSIGKKTYD